MTDENGKYNYAKAVHHYPPFFDISCSAKNYKIASALTLTGKLHSYLADLNKQAQNRCWLIIKQMAAAEGVTEDLKRRSQWEWIKAMNSIVSRTEEIIKSEIINA